MTGFQKLIKLFGQLLAIFLSLIIIFTIIMGIYGIGTFISARKDNNREDVKNISCNNYNGYFDEIIINTIYSDLEVVSSNKFKIEANNNIKCKLYNDTIKIEEKSRWKRNKIVVYLPETSKIKIDTGAGSLYIAKIRAKNITLSLGAGLTTIENLNAESAKIDTGAGKLVIEDSTFNDFDFDMGVGSADLSVNVINKADIDAGIGTLKLNLVGLKTDYLLNVSKGIGNIIVDGNDISNDEVIGRGERKIKIDGGIGTIKVNFSSK